MQSMENKKRLIFADDIKEKRTVLWDPALGYSACVLIEDIDEAPAVDAVEVVHGQWLKVKDGFDIDRGWKCSSCNNYVYAMTYEPYEYCPHCGAMMDGGNEDG